MGFSALDDNKAGFPLIYGDRLMGKVTSEIPTAPQSIIIHRQAILNSLYIVSGRVWATLCFLPGDLPGLSFGSVTHPGHVAGHPARLGQLLTSMLRGARATPRLLETNSVSTLTQGNPELLPDNLILRRKNSITK